MFPKISGMMLGAGAAAGFLFDWGLNGHGQLGDGTTVSKSSPIQIGSKQWVATSAGDYHQVSVAVDGTLWATGRNNNGQLGDGTVVDKSSPVQIGSLTDWAKVYCGGYHTVAVKKDGTLWAWGGNNRGQLGDGSVTSKSSPVQIGALTDWGGARFACGGIHTVAVKPNGTLWAWGGGDSGQLGDNSGLDRSSPVQVGALTNWKMPATGRCTTICVKTDGTLWGWGNSSYYQLWTSTGPGSPVQLGAGTTWDVVGTGSKNNHFWGVKTDGALWGWGQNQSGQVGDGTSGPYRTSPVQIGALTNWGAPASSIDRRPAMSRRASHAIQSDGSLWGVGGSNGAALGDNTAVSKSSPVQIGAGTAWLSVRAGMYTLGAISR